MKNISQILNILLAVALVIMVIKVRFIDTNKPIVTEVASNKKNQTLESISNRSSVRSYTDQKVEEKKIEQLLRAAMASPTAGNKQPWSFIVVNDKKILETLAENMPYAKMISKAGIAIVVCGDSNKMLSGKESEYWIQDCSAASQNILLAAESLGLGAVWTGVFPMKERVDKVKEILKMPDNLIPLNVIPIGYPSGENKPKDKWNPSVIHYNSF